MATQTATAVKDKEATSAPQASQRATASTRDAAAAVDDEPAETLTFLCLGLLQRNGRMVVPGDMVTFSEGEEEHIDELFANGLLGDPTDPLAMTAVKRTTTPDFVKRQMAKGADRRGEVETNKRRNLAAGIVDQLSGAVNVPSHSDED